MKVLFIIGWLKAQKTTNTTVWLYTEFLKKGHDAWFMDFLDFTVRPDFSLVGKCVKPLVSRDRVSRSDVVRSIMLSKVETHTFNINDFDVFFLRNNPMDKYSVWKDKVGNPAVDFLEIVKSDTKIVINDPFFMYKASLFTYFKDLPSYFYPKTLISRDQDELVDFVEHEAPVVLKPFKGYGGNHVFFIESKNQVNLYSIIDTLITNGYVIAQKYIPEAKHGDKRIVLWNGRVIKTPEGYYSAYKRIHKKEDFRNNIHRGGYREKTTLSETELTILEKVGEKLKNDKIYLAGVDMAGGKLIEVNVFSPGGIHNCSELYDFNFAGYIVDDIEKMLK